MNEETTIESSSNELEGNLSTKVTLDESSYDIDSFKQNHVNLRLTIALAIPTDSSSSGESPVSPSLTTTTRRTSETSKIQGYYRVEYSLFPGEPNVGFDIVVFRTAAKIYPDNQESHIVFTWEDQHENVWIVWEQIHVLDLDRDRLLALLSHQILVKIWDGKEYCSVRTRLDKPRISRTLSNTQRKTFLVDFFLFENVSSSDFQPLMIRIELFNYNIMILLRVKFHQRAEIPRRIFFDFLLLRCFTSLLNNSKNPKNIVQRIAENYAEKWIPKPLLYKLHRKLPIELPLPSSSLEKKILNTGDTRSIAPVDPVAVPTVEQTENLPPALFKIDMNENEKQIAAKKKRKNRTIKQVDEKREKGSAQMTISTKFLFAGFKMITQRLDDDAHLPRAIQDFFVSLTIDDHSVLKEILAREFNPLTITICHAENMPSTPISHVELRERCEPVYCSYQLFNQPVHQTERKCHATDIYWNDLNLFFINTIDEENLTQFQNSPFLNIELHDRDERVNSRRRTGSVFGSENADESIGRVSGKMDLLKTKNEPERYPHGCVRLDLSELWLGQTSLEFYVPVVPCHANDSTSGRSKSGKRISAGKHAQIQQGDFLSNGTQMKILVRLSQPLIRPVDHQPPFTRIIFLFSNENSKFLTSLETSIRMINAKALGFDSHPAHVQVAALSTYKLTEAQETSKTLNIVTGFHLFDDEQHLFVLEGRKQEAIDVLYEKLPKPEGKNVEILYDSSIHFNERLYVKFGPDIIHIKLSRKLRDIVSQPLIFVRETLPKETFEALDKLNQLVHAGKLIETARHNLFPKIEMINSLNRDFGVPLTEKEIKLFSSDDRTPSASTVHDKDEKSLQHDDESRLLEKTNPPSRDEIHSTQTNFLQRNVEQVQLNSFNCDVINERE